MSKLSKATFIQWNAALIAKAAGWQHSLVTPWPDPGLDANRTGGLERYLDEMQSFLDYMREEAGLAVPRSPDLTP